MKGMKAVRISAAREQDPKSRKMVAFWAVPETHEGCLSRLRNLLNKLTHLSRKLVAVWAVPETHEGLPQLPPQHAKTNSCRAAHECI
jgi:hypothetical protein